MPKGYSQKHTIILDIGTTGVKALVFDKDLRTVSEAYQPLAKFTPQSNWVEQSPDQLLTASKTVLQQAIKDSHISPTQFTGLGITNQRETTILWNKETGRPIYPAIVWEDKRAAKFCQDLKNKHEKTVKEKTGLCLDPYFSATEIWWLLQNIPEAKKLARQNRLAFGTVDAWILENWLEGDEHLTDSTNASRTLLYNVRTSKWDKELLNIFGIPQSILPMVKPSAYHFGEIKASILGFSLPVLAVCGDQQASTYAAGTEKGTTKITYGTGTFIAQNIGSQFGLYKPFFTMLLPSQAKPVYAVEGKIESSAQEVEAVLKKPRELKKVIINLAQKVDTYIQCLPIKPEKIVIDGGITKYKALASIQSKISDIPVERQVTCQSTALGVAKMIKNNY